MSKLSKEGANLNIIDKLAVGMRKVWSVIAYRIDNNSNKPLWDRGVLLQRKYPLSAISDWI